MTFGLCLVLFLAGIQKIPISLYEAARVDGAGRVREFFAVTLPGLRGELAVALTLTTIMALRTFDLIYVSTTGGPGTSTTVPSVLVYQNAFANGRVGLAAAVAVVLTLLIFVVAFGITRIVDRDPTNDRLPPRAAAQLRRARRLRDHRDLPDPQHRPARPPQAQSDLVTGFSIPDYARLRHVQDRVAARAASAAGCSTASSSRRP